MDIRQYVDEILQAPVTRTGSLYIAKAIEFVANTGGIKFYSYLTEEFKCTARLAEKNIRDAKSISLNNLSNDDKLKMFGTLTPRNSEYIIKAAEYYRRVYADESKR